MEYSKKDNVKTNMKNYVYILEKIKKMPIDYQIRKILFWVSMYLIGSLELYDNFSVFSIALYINSVKNKHRDLITALILILASIRTHSPMISIKLLSIIMFTVLVSKGLKLRLTGKLENLSIYKLSALYSILYLMLSIAILYIAGEINLYKSILEILASMLIFTSGIMLNKACKVMNSPRITSVLEKDAIISLLLYLLLLITSLNGIFFYGIYLQETIIFLTLEIVAFTVGEIYAGCIGTLLTIPLMIKGGYEVNLSILSFLGIIMGILKNINKYMFALMYSITAYILYLTYSDSLNMSITFLNSLIVAQTIFILIPTSSYEKIASGFDEILKYKKKSYYEKIKSKLCKDLKEKSSKIENFINIYKKTLLDTDAKEENKKTIDKVIRTICGNCINKDDCWKNSFYTTYTLMMDTFRKVNEKEKTEEIIDFCLKNNCPNGLCLTNQFLIEDRRNRNFAIEKNMVLGIKNSFLNYLDENRKMLTDMANDIAEYKVYRNHLEKEIFEMYEEKEIDVLDIEVSEINDIYDVTLLVSKYYKDLEEITKKILYKKLKKKFNIKSIKNEENYIVIKAYQQENLNLDYGVFQMPKCNTEVSGDNYSILRYSNQRVMVSIADGMGKGSVANEKSKLALELLESLVKLELSEQVTIELINSLLLNNGEVFTTLDICIIDLYTKKCKFIKSGSVSTYIKRDEEVIMVNSRSLPIGVVNKISINVIDFEIQKNDMIVMVSDGVIDNINNQNEREEYLINSIREIGFQKAQNFAFKVGCQIAKNNILRDDMTLICINVN